VPKTRRSEENVILFGGKGLNIREGGGNRRHMAIYYQTKQGDLIMMKKLFKTNKHPVMNQGGQGLVEYALILVLIAVAIMGGVTLLQGKIWSSYSKVGSSIQAP
jgi:Flp pilus assembly pilin Flp